MTNDRIIHIWKTYSGSGNFMVSGINHISIKFWLKNTTILFIPIPIWYWFPLNGRCWTWKVIIINRNSIWRLNGKLRKPNYVFDAVHCAQKERNHKIRTKTCTIFQGKSIGNKWNLYFNNSKFHWMFLNIVFPIDQFQISKIFGIIALNGLNWSAAAVGYQMKTGW